MDVGDDRHTRPLDELGERIGVRNPRDGDADDVDACLDQSVDLRHRRLDVVRLGGRHRLHRDGGPAPIRTPPTTICRSLAIDCIVGDAERRPIAYGPIVGPLVMCVMSFESPSVNSISIATMPISDTRS